MLQDAAKNANLPFNLCALLTQIHTKNQQIVCYFGRKLKATASVIDKV